MCWGWPLSWSFVGPDAVGVLNMRTGEPVALPDAWVLPVQYGIGPPLEEAIEHRRDPAYEWARYDWPVSWQRRWWRASDEVLGLLIVELTRVWSCTVESLLAPPASREWTDTAALPGPDGGEEMVGGMWLRRPG